MKALIPAAGMGTRFLPATIAVPKEMLPVLNKPIIQYIVEEGHASGADEVIIINSREKKAIEAHFAPHDALVKDLRAKGKDALAQTVVEAAQLPVKFAYQDEPLGLGHAIHCAAEYVQDEQFFVLLGDVFVPDQDICTRMLEVSRAHNNANVIAVLPVPDEEVHRFGIIAGKEVEPGVWKVDNLVEKPALQDAPSNLSIFGRYLLSPRIMQILEHTPAGAGAEIQLTDALMESLATEDMYALVINNSQGLDAGTVESWLEANKVMSERA